MEITNKNLKLMNEIFLLGVKETINSDNFSCTVQYSAHVNWLEVDIDPDGYGKGYKGRVSECIYLEYYKDKDLTERLIELKEMILTESEASKVRWSKSNVEATKEKAKQEKIARLKKQLESLES